MLPTPIHLTILYRGPLSSCNYGCEYCPFAKRQNSAAELGRDREALTRLVNWVEQQQNHEFSFLFTPWGEALIHAWYQQALMRLTQMPHVRKAAIQTNLSCNLDWVDECDRERLALWATFHPDWVERDRFIAKCLNLDHRGVRFSVGVVGLPQFREAIAALRRELPPHIYLWINAVKRELSQMPAAVLDFFRQIDPLFTLNTHHYPSLGRTCGAGTSVISVDGEGTVRRCHFIPEPLGNLYDPGFIQALSNGRRSVGNHRPCTNLTCHCHIGYVHLDYLELHKVFGSGILERIPELWPKISQAPGATASDRLPAYLI